MALHIAEVYLNMTSPENAKAALAAAQNVAAARLPPGFRLVSWHRRRSRGRWRRVLPGAVLRSDRRQHKVRAGNLQAGSCSTGYSPAERERASTTR